MLVLSSQARRESDVLVSSWRICGLRGRCCSCRLRCPFLSRHSKLLSINERANKLAVLLGEGGFRYPERLACFAQRSAQGPKGNDDLARQSTIQSPHQRISAGLEQPLIFFSVPFVTTPKRAARTRTETSAV